MTQINKFHHRSKVQGCPLAPPNGSVVPVVSDDRSLFVHSVGSFAENVWRARLWVRRQVLSTQRVGVWRSDGADCARPSYYR